MRERNFVVVNQEVKYTSCKIVMLFLVVSINWCIIGDDCTDARFTTKVYLLRAYYFLYRLTITTKTTTILLLYYDVLYYSATTSINPTTLLRSYSTTLLQYYFPFLCLKHEVRQRVARRASPGPLLHCCGLPARQSFACAGVPRRQFRAIIFYIRI